MLVNEAIKPVNKSRITDLKSADVKDEFWHLRDLKEPKYGTGNLIIDGDTIRPATKEELAGKYSVSIEHANKGDFKSKEELIDFANKIGAEKIMFYFEPGDNYSNEYSFLLSDRDLAKKIKDEYDQTEFAEFDSEGTYHGKTESLKEVKNHPWIMQRTEESLTEAVNVTDWVNKQLDDLFNGWIELAMDIPSEMVMYDVSNEKDYARARMQELADDPEELEYYMSEQAPEWEGYSKEFTKEELIKAAKEYLKNKGYLKEEESKNYPWIMQVTEDSEPEFIGFAPDEDTMIDILVDTHRSDAVGKMTTIDVLDYDIYLDMKERGMFDEEDEEKLDAYFAADESLKEDIEKHDTLNPKLWDGNELKPEVKEKIDLIVKDFLDGLEEDGIKIKVDDIKLVGSNCSYNYNKDSDLDIHIVADTDSLECPDDLYPLLYSAYRSIWNKNHDVTFYGIPVELYIETSDTVDLNQTENEEPRELEEASKPSALKSNGIYSVLHNKWIKEPVQADIPDLDREAFDKLFNEWEDKYFAVAEKSDVTIDEINDFIEDLYDLRKTSIAKDGEYGLGNLTFKECRALGYLDNLRQLKKEIRDRELSLESLK